MSLQERIGWEAGDIVLLPAAPERRFDPEQPRDEGGKWTVGGADWHGEISALAGSLLEAKESVMAAAIAKALAPGQPLPPGMTRLSADRTRRAALAAINTDKGAMKLYGQLKPGEVPQAELLNHMFEDHRDEIVSHLEPIKEGQQLWQDEQPLAADQEFVRAYEPAREADDENHPGLQGAELNRQEAEMLSHLRGGGGELAAIVANDGKLVFASSGTKSEVKFTDADIARIQRATLLDDNVVGTHCHPGTAFNSVRAGGGAFSPPDIGTACHMRLREMRVVSERWTHVFRGAKQLSDADFRMIAPVGERAQREYMDNVDRAHTNILEVEERGWHHIWSEVARTYPDRYSYYRFPTVKP